VGGVGLSLTTVELKGKGVDGTHLGCVVSCGARYSRAAPQDEKDEGRHCIRKSKPATLNMFLGGTLRKGWLVRGGFKGGF